MEERTGEDVDNNGDKSEEDENHSEDDKSNSGVDTDSEDDEDDKPADAQKTARHAEERKKLVRTMAQQDIDAVMGPPGDTNPQARIKRESPSQQLRVHRAGSSYVPRDPLVLLVVRREHLLILGIGTLPALQRQLDARTGRPPEPEATGCTAHRGLRTRC